MFQIIRKAHKFFMKDGLDFVRIDPIIYDEYTRGGNTVQIKNKGRIPIKSLLYSPIAYSKFMYYSLSDFITSKHVKK